MCSTLEVEIAAKSLIQVEKTTLGIEATTHVCYPNGDLVRVTINCTEEKVVVADGSYASLYLANMGIKLSRQQRERALFIVKHYGCDYYRSSVQKSTDRAGIANAIALVANASRSVADFGIETRKASDGEFRVSVIERVRKVVGSRLREREPVEGVSGRSYRVGGVVLDQHQASPLAFIEAFATRTTVSDRFAEFYDLRKAHKNVEMIAVYDDAISWPKADLALLMQVSSVIPYSNSQSTLDALA